MCPPQSAGLGIRAGDLDILERRKRKENSFPTLPAIRVRNLQSRKHPGSPHHAYWLKVEALDSETINDISEALPSKNFNQNIGHVICHARICIRRLDVRERMRE